MMRLRDYFSIIPFWVFVLLRPIYSLESDKCPYHETEQRRIAVRRHAESDPASPEQIPPGMVLAGGGYSQNEEYAAREFMQPEQMQRSYIQRGQMQDGPFQPIEMQGGHIHPMQLQEGFMHPVQMYRGNIQPVPMQNELLRHIQMQGGGLPLPHQMQDVRILQQRPNQPPESQPGYAQAGHDKDIALHVGSGSVELVVGGSGLVRIHSEVPGQTDILIGGPGKQNKIKVIKADQGMHRSYQDDQQGIYNGYHNGYKHIYSGQGDAYPEDKYMSPGNKHIYTEHRNVYPMNVPAPPLMNIPQPSLVNNAKMDEVNKTETSENIKKDHSRLTRDVYPSYPPVLRSHKVISPSDLKTFGKEKDGSKPESTKDVIEDLKNKEILYKSYEKPNSSLSESTLDTSSQKPDIIATSNPAELASLSRNVTKISDIDFVSKITTDKISLIPEISSSTTNTSDTTSLTPETIRSHTNTSDKIFFTPEISSNITNTSDTTSLISYTTRSHTDISDKISSTPEIFSNTTDTSNVTSLTPETSNSSIDASINNIKYNYSTQSLDDTNKNRNSGTLSTLIFNDIVTPKASIIAENITSSTKIPENVTSNTHLTTQNSKNYSAIAESSINIVNSTINSPITDKESNKKHSDQTFPVIMNITSTPFISEKEVDNVSAVFHTSLDGSQTTENFLITTNSSNIIKSKFNNSGTDILSTQAVENKSTENPLNQISSTLENVTLIPTPLSSVSDNGTFDTHNNISKSDTIEDDSDMRYRSYALSAKSNSSDIQQILNTEINSAQNNTESFSTTFKDLETTTTHSYETHNSQTNATLLAGDPKSVSNTLLQSKVTDVITNYTYSTLVSIELTEASSVDTLIENTSTEAAKRKENESVTEDTLNKELLENITDFTISENTTSLNETSSVDPLIKDTSSEAAKQKKNEAVTEDTFNKEILRNIKTTSLNETSSVDPLIKNTSTEATKQKENEAVTEDTMNKELLENVTDFVISENTTSVNETSSFGPLIKNTSIEVTKQKENGTVTEDTFNKELMENVTNFVMSENRISLNETSSVDPLIKDTSTEVAKQKENGAVTEDTLKKEFLENVTDFVISENRTSLNNRREIVDLQPYAHHIKNYAGKNHSDATDSEEVSGNITNVLSMDIEKTRTFPNKSIGSFQNNSFNENHPDADDNEEVPGNMPTKLSMHIEKARTFPNNRIESFQNNSFNENHPDVVNNEEVPGNMPTELSMHIEKAKTFPNNRIESFQNNSFNENHPDVVDSEEVPGNMPTVLSMHIEKTRNFANKKTGSFQNNSFNENPPDAADSDEVPGNIPTELSIRTEKSRIFPNNRTESFQNNSFNEMHSNAPDRNEVPGNMPTELSMQIEKGRIFQNISTGSFQNNGFNETHSDTADNDEVPRNLPTELSIQMQTARILPNDSTGSFQNSSFNKNHPDGETFKIKFKNIRNISDMSNTSIPQQTDMNVFQESKTNNTSFLVDTYGSIKDQTTRNSKLLAVFNHSDEIFFRHADRAQNSNTSLELNGINGSNETKLIPAPQRFTFDTYRNDSSKEPMIKSTHFEETSYTEKPNNLSAQLDLQKNFSDSSPQKINSDRMDIKSTTENNTDSPTMLFSKVTDIPKMVSEGKFEEVSPYSYLKYTYTPDELGNEQTSGPPETIYDLAEQSNSTKKSTKVATSAEMKSSPVLIHTSLSYSYISTTKPFIKSNPDVKTADSKTNNTATFDGGVNNFSTISMSLNQTETMNSLVNHTNLDLKENFTVNNDNSMTNPPYKSENTSLGKISQILFSSINVNSNSSDLNEKTPKDIKIYRVTTAYGRKEYFNPTEDKKANFPVLNKNFSESKGTHNYKSNVSSTTKQGELLGSTTLHSTYQNANTDNPSHIDTSELYNENVSEKDVRLAKSLDNIALSSRNFAISSDITVENINEAEQQESSRDKVSSLAKLKELCPHAGRRCNRRILERCVKQFRNESDSNCHKLSYEDVITAADGRNPTSKDRPITEHAQRCFVRIKKSCSRETFDCIVDNFYQGGFKEQKESALYMC